MSRADHDQNNPDCMCLLCATVRTTNTIRANTVPGRVEAVMHPDLAEKLGLEGETVYKCVGCATPVEREGDACGSCAEWRDVGPGPGMNEVLRERLVRGGKLVAVVVVTKGYARAALTEDSNKIIVTGEVTRSITFVPTGG